MHSAPLILWLLYYSAKDETKRVKASEKTEKPLTLAEVQKEREGKLCYELFHFEDYCPGTAKRQSSLADPLSMKAKKQKVAIIAKPARPVNVVTYDDPQRDAWIGNLPGNSDNPLDLEESQVTATQGASTSQQGPSTSLQDPKRSQQAPSSSSHSSQQGPSSMPLPQSQNRTSDNTVQHNTDC